MTMKMGTRLLTELQFHTIDPEWLGSESEDDEGDADKNKDLASILRS